jgi:signal transduction histidine kinase
MTALLLVFAYRRFSPGVLLSVAGMVGWSLYALQAVPAIAGGPALDLALIRLVVMSKVVAALGMILLALEGELAKNLSSQERERRARRELEAYAKLVVSRRRVDDFDRQGSEICQIVVENSRFAQAALVLHSVGRYRLAGSAGLDEATARALSELAARIPPNGLLAPGTAAPAPTPAVDQAQALRLDLDPWLEPGDDLKRLHFTSVLAVPMTSRGAVDGALLLAGMRPTHTGSPAQPAEPLRADDLLPIELLVARLQASRIQAMMFEKLIDSEKFAHLGQLAGNVSQQLNNPLTVVLGYASLLDETSVLEPHDRKAVQSILSEARHMRTTLESLARISRPHSDELTAVSVAELLADMGELHRTEFLRRSIDFRLSIAPSLPRVMCSAQQLRQAVRHCLQFAIDAVDTAAPASSEPQAVRPRIVRMEAASEGSLVQILVGHSGPAFSNPERAFDPFAAPHAEGLTASLGLSLCATLMRDNNGRAIAVNFEPHGAGIVLELQAA